jgi:diguanylate cyclase (GGDEF)-like protein/PAS domain S-box-containing protein
MEEPFFKDLLDDMHEGIYILDSNLVITFWNKSAERITGYLAKETIGKSCCNNFLNLDTDTGLKLCMDHCPMQYTMHDGEPREKEMYLNHADGHRIPVLVHAMPIFDNQRNIIGSLCTFIPNHAQLRTRKRMKELEDTALLDELTQIGNRRYLERHLKASMLEFDLDETRFGVLFCDIDNFKLVNDTYGHNSGDKILRMVSQTLKASIRATDVVGRWGGEEFLVIMQDLDKNELFVIAEKLLIKVAKSHIEFSDNTVSPTISIGGTMVQKGDAAETVVNRADKLMYQSKANGRNRITIG